MKKDLIGNSGLPIDLDLQDFHLRFKDALPQAEPAIRTIGQMKEVLLDKQLQSPEELYYMYRDIALPEDRETIKKNKLRYDITVIKPDRLGGEFMKTAGHYHPGNYPELYEVIYGQAWCLLQRPLEEDFRRIADVILVKAKAGEKIVCLPHYGHILINPSKDDPLVTANWVGTQFNSDYAFYKQAQGAAYFILDKQGGVKQVKNKSFTEVPEIKEMYPAAEIKRFGLKKGSPIYLIIKDNVDKLSFLNNYHKFDFSDCFVQ